MSENVEGTGGTSNPVGNSGTESQTLDVSGLVSQLEAANKALAEKDAQYKGLQKTYNTLYESNKALLQEKEDLSSNLLTLQNQLDAAGNEQGAFKDQLETLRGEYSNLESKLGQLEGEKERTDLIIQEYPELLPFEAKGLLPTVEDGGVEALKSKLDAFKETMGQNVQIEVDEELEGAGTGSTGGGSSETPKRGDILSKMMRLAGNPEKRDEYNQLQTQLDELDAKS